MRASSSPKIDWVLAFRIDPEAMPSVSIALRPRPLGLGCLLLAAWTALVGCRALGGAQQPVDAAQEASLQAGLRDTQIAGTVEVQVAGTLAALTPSVTATAEPAAVATTQLPPSSTPVPSNPVISVSQNTNCRSGPAANYPYRGVLLAGESAVVLAHSTVESYWYIENPDLPGEACWLWDEYATLQGDPSGLPSYTPEPSPIPALDFALYLNSIAPCGSTTYVHLTVQNTGGTRLMSGHISIVDLDNGQMLHGPLINRHPFNFGPLCPPDHGNRLDPGQTAYISADIHPVPSGHFARATFKGCTGDYAGGDCVTRTIDFQIP